MITIEQLFGTLQQSVVSTWRKHLRTAKYGNHMALNDFYEDMPDKVDALIEAWMGVNGKKIKSYDNVLMAKNMNTLLYLKELRKICKQGYPLMNGESELEGLLDDIVELIDSTLYKVKELDGNGQAYEGYKDLSDFINEALNESAKYNYNKNSFNSKDCLTWLIKTKQLPMFDSSKYDIDEWAQMAQDAAEDAGLPLDAAEAVYDMAYEVQNK